MPLLDRTGLVAGPAADLTLANTARIDALAAEIAAAKVIAVTFPSFADGRGFSIARQLRLAGFKGRLRAAGPVIPDQFAYALACGFDEVEIPDEQLTRQPVEHWLAALGAISNVYQRDRAPGHSILDQRRAARAGAA